MFHTNIIKNNFETSLPVQYYKQVFTPGRANDPTEVLDGLSSKKPNGSFEVDHQNMPLTVHDGQLQY